MGGSLDAVREDDDGGMGGGMSDGMGAGTGGGMGGGMGRSRMGGGGMGGGGMGGGSLFGVPDGFGASDSGPKKSSLTSLSDMPKLF